jgi:hypothetical protein
VPAGQTFSGKHVGAFGVLEYVPELQALHARSVNDVPAELTNEPGSQFDHGTQDAALAVTLKVLLLHCVHVRSCVAVPGA